MPALHHGFSVRFHWSGYLLGLALGGFFDGILLHQILQWHHLLSGLEGEAFRDIRVQVLADGLFHALMYLVAAVGLWLLWRARDAFDAGGAGRVLFSDLLIGFGVWHVLDAFLSHWLLGIHRIRMDSATPLAWDLGWLVAFGIVPLMAGVLLRRTPGGGAPVRGRAVAACLAAAVLGAGAVAALPPRDLSEVVVWFGPGATAEQALAAAAAVDARIVWSDRSGELWAFSLEDPARARELYRRGALFVGGSLLPAACLSWSRMS